MGVAHHGWHHEPYSPVKNSMCKRWDTLINLLRWKNHRDASSSWAVGSPPLILGLDHGVGHFRPLTLTRHRHLLTYHCTAMSHEDCVKYFNNFCHCNSL